MTEQHPDLDLNYIGGRKAYSISALGTSAIFIVVSVIQIVAVVLISLFAPDFTKSEYYIWVVAELPMYLLGFPAGFLILKLAVPAVRPEKRKMSFSVFMTALCVSMLAISMGSAVGQAVASISEKLFGRASTDSLDMFLDNGLLSLVFIALIGPVFEELFFRKFVIDRVLPYGEKTAVLFSAFVFALFHGNLEQFFYAFAVGIVFGYIYVRYGTAVPGMILHIMINLYGGVLTPWLSSKVGEIDTSLIETFTNPYLYVISALGVLRLAISLTGLILLIVFRKRIFFTKQPNELAPGSAGRAVFLNVGMVIFIIIEAANIVLSFLQ
ncbi:MAG: CPBP family intramembrane metalloprotease [Clostridia bacterium]|nr:CPBP family intramembrane metalloprotease [Clostridia bacterium]